MYQQSQQACCSDKRNTASSSLSDKFVIPYRRQDCHHTQMTYLLLGLIETCEKKNGFLPKGQCLSTMSFLLTVVFNKSRKFREVKAGLHNQAVVVHTFNSSTWEAEAGRHL